MDNRAIQDEANIAVVPPAPRDDVPSMTHLNKASDYLEDNSRIGSHRSHYLKYRRYVNLNSSNIFTALVNLYTPLFQSQWSCFKRTADAFTPPPGVSAYTYLTRVYISHWFLDLYVSNRESIMKLSALALAQHYSHEMVHQSNDYDHFLCLLNASIRPTHIKGSMEDALYIPILQTNLDWTNEYDANFNPFGISNFSFNYEYFMGIMDLLKERKNWSLSTLVTDTTGRPSWLFDWHGTACCAWFPAEGNYSADDVTIAYIIGEACTPKLGPRDIDDWTFFPDGSQNNIDLNTLQRTVPRRFYGSYEERTYDVRSAEYPVLTYSSAPTATKKRKTTTGLMTIGEPSQAASSSTTQEPTTAMEISGPTPTTSMEIGQQFQITDWTYHCRVILEIDVHTRSGALRMITLN